MGAWQVIRDTLMRRSASGYATGLDHDGEHVALVVEGGGMRGVAAGGMVSALEDLGLTDCFDSVHGSSAGAAAGAYFVCKQANFGTRIFFEDLNDKRFINPMRLAIGQNIMDTGYLVDYVMTDVKPIDFGRLTEISPRLHIVSTNIDSGEPHIVSKFRDYEHYKECLKSSLTMPFIAGGPRIVDQMRLMDGGLVQQIAIESALSIGATMILGLQTRRKDEQIRPESSWKIRLQAQAIQCMYGGKIGEIYLDRSRRTNASVAMLKSSHSPNGAALFGVDLPPSVDYIHRMAQSKANLEKAAIVSKQYLTELFDD